jgi:nucleotide-binding universal stress UspA family protein
LIATDGSKHSERASEAGIEMARLFQGSVTALNVVDPSKAYGPMGDMLTSRVADELMDDVRNSLRSQGEAATRRVEEKARQAGVPAMCLIIEGYPADEIMKLSWEEKMDLIVLGSIGVSGLEKFLLGSVAERVARNSKVPVLVVRA